MQTILILVKGLIFFVEKAREEKGKKCKDFEMNDSGSKSERMQCEWCEE